MGVGIIEGGIVESGINGNWRNGKMRDKWRRWAMKPRWFKLKCEIGVSEVKRGFSVVFD